MTDNKKIPLPLLQEIFSKQADIFKDQLQLLREFASSQAPTQHQSTLPDQRSLAHASLSPPQQTRESIKIAVIGMAGRFPGARNVGEFWKNLNAGIESITTFRPEEIDLAVPAEERLHPQYGHSRGILEDADKFDAEFFRISPREAKLIDPQQRIFLEVSYEALQDAGYDPDQYKGEIGVYGGVGDNFYHINNVLDKKDLINKVGSLTTTVGNMKDYAATRVSYKLNLKGPSISLNTACSTSLVAIDQAVLGLRNFTCDMALAGASSIYVPQKAGFMFGPGSPFSSDGHIKPFSSDATGVMFSDGAGMVVLKRLDDAIRDRDHVYGVIIGSALNNDGTDKMSFFAPSSEGQCKVISKALRDAGVSAETLSFVEAHATGTMLGDPVEFEGLKAAFAPYTQKKNFCAIGAYKANVGHVDAAAGVAGLIKALLALKYKNLPRNINFTSANPEINLADSPFFIPVNPVPLKNPHGPLRAGVSAFGFGGTNAHVIIEESPPAAPSVQTKPLCLLLLSAETDAAWHRNAGELARHLKEHPETALADVEYTLALGRKGFSKRSYIVAKDRNEALALLEQSPSQNPLHPLSPVDKHQQKPPLAFMFPGQGTQSLDMGRGLYESSQKFRDTVDRCSEILRPLIAGDLREIIYPGPNGRREAEERLEQTVFAQPALFVIQYAMVQVFLDLGLKPDALVGHSLGEITCATLSSVLSLEDALFLVAERGRLMQKMAPGSMLSVNLSHDDVLKLLDDTISVAAINGPKQCVLSGSQSSLDRIRRDLEHKGIGCRSLKTSHGFHSPTVDSIRDDFLKACSKITFHPPRIPYVSTLTAAWITPGEAQNPSYWFQHMRQPVRFYDSVKALWARDPYLLIELGPRETASLLARKASTDPDRYRAIPTLVGDDSYRSFAEAIGQLWTTGLEINWQKFFAPDVRNRVSLPTYSFEKVSHWLETIPADPVPQTHNLTDLASYKQSKQISHLDISDPPPSSTPTRSSTTASSRSTAVADSLKESVRALFLEAAGISIPAAREKVGFLELGFDSLSLAQVSAGLKRNFSVEIPYGKIIRDKNTFEKLTQYLSTEMGNTLHTSSSPTIGGISTQPILEDQAYPVSFSQRRMWMHAQIAPKATTYHIPLYFSIKGRLHTDRFRQSIEHCVGRHHILRSTYHLENGNIVQKFSSKIPLAYTEVDLSSHGIAGAKDQLEALLIKYARIPFQLDRESMIRFYLFKLAPDLYVFFLNAHHILFDLVSIQTFLTEVGQTYKSLASGATLDKDKAAVQYIDFVHWQQNWAQSGAMDKQIAYWREQLGSSPLPVLSMPTFTPRPAVQPEIDSNFSFKIEKAPLRALLDQTTQ